tara:strand:- start:205 stop:441 length:237 start_codon:yes stop_codon:yes gene_type:complete
MAAGEQHSYVQINVKQQSSGSQTPELRVDANLKCEAHGSQNEIRQGSLLVFSSWLMTVKVQEGRGFILVLKLFSSSQF